MAELHQYAVSRVRASRVAVVTALSAPSSDCAKLFLQPERSFRNSQTCLRPIIQHGAWAEFR
jgi:hypothetical protein